MAEQHGFAASRLAEDGDVFGALALRDRDRAGTDPAVYYRAADLKIGPAGVRRAPAAEPVPDVGDGLFYKVTHGNLRLLVLLAVSGLIVKPLIFRGGCRLAEWPLHRPALMANASPPRFRFCLG
ncbi:MAG: hypothetical protein ABR860_00615 [Terracidiphilus sp.]